MTTPPNPRRSTSALPATQAPTITTHSLRTSPTTTTLATHKPSHSPLALLHTYPIPAPARLQTAPIASIVAATTLDGTVTALPAANACQGTFFPSAALQQAHYLAAHARVKIIAPDASILRKQTKYKTNRNTPPTSPFMQRSAASTPTDHSYNQPPSSALPEQAPDDSGYDSVFSNASTTDY